MNLFRVKRRNAMFFGTALFFVVAVLDQATSNALSLAAFYLFPILLVAWNCGRGWGLVFAVGAVGAQVARLLKAIADVAVETLRRSDTVGRIGGDEFAVILPETARTEALFVVDKLQHKLRAVTRQRRWGVSFSIGVAVFDKTPGAATAAMEFADRLMYTAKESSKGFTVWNSFGDPARVPTIWEVRTIGASDNAPISEPVPKA